MPRWHHVALAAALLVPTGALQAAESPPVVTTHARAALVSDTDAVTAGRSLHVALDLRLAPGWHTYWHNPGDAGVPVALTLHLPKGAQAGPILWPTPSRQTEGDLVTYGYTGHLVLPVPVLPGSGPLHVTASASWLVCRDVCVPEQADLTLDLPEGRFAPSSQAPSIDAALNAVPKQPPFSATVAPDGTLTLSGAGLPPPGSTADFIPALDGAVDHTPAQPLRRTGSDSLSVKIAAPPLHDPASALPGVLTVTPPNGPSIAYDVSAMPTKAAPATPSVAGGLLALLAASLAGGLLLNLMPCVFPVLALKAMSLSRLSRTDARSVRAETLSYTAGVVLAFTGLGAALLLARSAGSAVGWGFQLQSPRFVTVLAWLLFATGLNMSGVFTVGSRLMGAGHALASRVGHAGSFFTGLFAVLVATPCTAAFMGAAVAGALASPAPVALAIFAAMGLGMALPYLAFAAVPRLAGGMPRPGAWMETLRQALAFPLYGSVAWLAWVVSQQSGPSGVLGLGFGLVCTGLAAWALGRTETGSPRIRLAGRAMGAAACIAAVLGMLGSEASPSDPSEPFSVARLEQLRQEGRPVFVNLTAAWCLSCLVNERLALSPTAVKNAFAQAHVAYLKGDWTRRDPAITAFLQQHGRDGVPLYLFYPPGKPAAVLPQLLGEATLLNQVRHLGS